MRADRGASRSLAPALIAAALALVGFLPLVEWIPGGRGAPWFGATLSDWLNGSLIVAGGTAVLLVLSRRLPALWWEGAGERVAAWSRASPRFATAALAVAAFAVYALVATLVFDARPLLVDEIVQVIQARIFADGALWRPAGDYPEFFSLLNVVDADGRYYAQFPPGGPAMLALGVLVGAPWIVGPLCGAVAVAAYAALVARVERRAAVAVGAALLFAFAPFMVFMAGSHMNHVPTLMWLVVAMAALARVVTSPSAAPGWALLCGLGLGAAATIRPVDALAFALPAAVWLLARAARDRGRWTDVLAAGVGVLLPIGVMMWVNAQTTGAPLRFGYEVLWGKSHALGFHQAPWGISHTPARGVELVSLYFLRLQSYLFETPIPSLLPAIAAFALTRRLEAFDRYLLVSGGLLVGLYFAYWHDGFYLGPRFVFPLLPLLALWTARLPALVRERFGGPAHRGTVYAYVVAALVALAVTIPLRVRQRAAELATMRWDAGAAAERAGVRNALVFVRESWGSQLVARLWGAGISRPESELLYKRVDSCLLDERLRDLERNRVRGRAAVAMLRPLLADSARVVASPVSPDSSERVLPGVAYTPTCLTRIREDRAGFTLLAPLLAAAPDGNVYARDLHARDSLLVARHPERPVFLLRPDDSALGAPPRFVPLSRDSLWRAWRAAE